MEHRECEHLLGALSQYLDGEASANVCAEIEKHLADCTNCRVVVDTLRKTILLYREQPKPVLNDDARARLYRSLDLQEFFVPRKSE
ncbi:MAG: zf-HC2 domain-containing protein [Chloroflexi bacterium]|nr:zf-HC2 domain-containing protein [Chloroflexota bacterium]